MMSIAAHLSPAQPRHRAVRRTTCVDRWIVHLFQTMISYRELSGEEHPTAVSGVNMKPHSFSVSDRSQFSYRINRARIVVPKTPTMHIGRIERL